MQFSLEIYETDYIFCQSVLKNVPFIFNFRRRDNAFGNRYRQPALLVRSLDQTQTIST